MMNFKSNFSLSSKLNTKNKQALFLELNILLSAGLDLNSAISLIIEESKNRIVTILTLVQKQIIGGAALHEAMSQTKMFQRFEINAVQIGEETGNLAIVTKSIADFYENKNQLRKQFTSALTYPVLVIVAAFIVLFFMLNNVVPMFGNIFNRFDQELPESTQFILSLSNWLNNNLKQLFIGVVSFVLLIVYLSRQTFWKNNVHKLIYTTPFIGKVFKQYHMAHFAQSMNLLLRSKISLDRALKLTSGMVTFLPVRNAIENIIPKLIGGKSLTQSMKEESVFSGKVITMIGVGESVNRLVESFGQLSDQLKKEMDHLSKLLNSFLEPALIIFVALIVGFILIAMYLPLFSLSTAVG